jgi:hypothetical protein
MRGCTGSLSQNVGQQGCKGSDLCVAVVESGYYLLYAPGEVIRPARTNGAHQAAPRRDVSSHDDILDGRFRQLPSGRFREMAMSHQWLIRRQCVSFESQANCLADALDLGEAQFCELASLQCRESGAPNPGARGEIA